MEALPPGRFLVIGDGMAADPGHRQRPAAVRRKRRTAVRCKRARPVPLLQPDELASFFDGLDLIEPGVVPCCALAAGRARGGRGGGADEGAGLTAPRSTRRPPTAA